MQALQAHLLWNGADPGSVGHLQTSCKCACACTGSALGIQDVDLEPQVLQSRTTEFRIVRSPVDGVWPKALRLGPQVFGLGVLRSRTSELRIVMSSVEELGPKVLGLGVHVYRSRALGFYSLEPQEFRVGFRLSGPKV